MREIRTHTKLPDERAERIRRDPPRIMDLNETAAYLGQSPRKTREDAKLGRIPMVKLGGRIRFRLVDIDRALERLSA